MIPRKVARPAGFEPAACGFEVRRSIRAELRAHKELPICNQSSNVKDFFRPVSAAYGFMKVWGSDLAVPLQETGRGQLQKQSTWEPPCPHPFFELGAEKKFYSTGPVALKRRLQPILPGSRFFWEKSNMKSDLTAMVPFVSFSPHIVRAV
jgi:hypothetical protein